jgi:hypothetical protein
LPNEALWPFLSLQTLFKETKPAVAPVKPPSCLNVRFLPAEMNKAVAIPAGTFHLL